MWYLLQHDSVLTFSWIVKDDLIHTKQIWNCTIQNKTTPV
nr:MAG TPA: hypothetical protein [Caudoviricetes sp.]